MPPAMSEKPFDHYLSFKLVDFVMDEEVQNWVLQQKPEQEAYWQSFKVAFPHKAELVDLASQAIRNLRVNEGPPTAPRELHEKFQAVLHRIDEAPSARVLPLHRRWWVRVAATLLLGVLTWQTYQYGWADKLYQTGAGKQQRVRLNDQTVVTLAARSTLRVPGRWHFHRQREVWLTGEAFFEVAKQAGDAPDKLRNFVVHAPELNVEVLGTQFNVSTFRRKTTVLLEEGKVQLSNTGKTGRRVILQPGQTGELQSHQSFIRVASTTDTTATAWRFGRLLFRAAELTDLNQRVEEVYGLTLVFDGAGWADASFTGELPATDVVLLAQLLGETFGATVVRDDNRLILRKHFPNP